MPAVFLTIGPWLLKNWKLFGVGLAIGFLGIALLLARGDALHWHKVADDRQAALALEVAKNRIDLASIAQCVGALNDQSAAVERMKVDGDARAKAALQASEAVRKAAEGAEQHARALEASAAAAKRDGACRASEAFAAAKDDL